MARGKNIRLILEYDGSRYHGWQRQKGVLTIQGVIEEQIQRIIREPVRLIASGRTDAGVHALNQVCNFTTKTRLDPGPIRRGLNALLPEDIHVKWAEYAPPDFHAMHCCTGKTYEYRILNQREANVFLRFYTWHVKGDLDLVTMGRCISSIRGRYDFSSFRSSGSGNINPVRELKRAELHGPERGLVRFIFEADGFLRHMVRNMVGTVVEAGQGKMRFEDFLKIFQSKDRRKAGTKAPAQGLFLTDVRY